MKTIPSAVTTQMEAQQKRPALLFEIGLSAGTLYYVAEKDDLTYAGNTYTAKAITLSNLTQSAEGQINRVTANFDNTSRDMAAYAVNAQFEGRPFIIKRVYKDALSDPTYYNELFRGTMEELTDMGRTWMPINAVAGKPLYQKALLSEYVRTCRHIFGGTQCNMNGFSDLTSISNYAEGTILTGTTNSMTIDTTIGSVTGTNDDAFNYGIIKIGKSGTTYIRTCTDWTAGTSVAIWSVALPVTIDNTYRYQIYKGCPKNLNSCTMGFAWGPSSNNHLNFGGFIHVGKELINTSQLSEGAEVPSHYYPPPWSPPWDTGGGDDGGWGGSGSDGPPSDSYGSGTGFGTGSGSGDALG